MPRDRLGYCGGGAVTDLERRRIAGERNHHACRRVFAFARARVGAGDRSRFPAPRKHWKGARIEVGPPGKRSTLTLERWRARRPPPRRRPMCTRSAACSTKAERFARRRAPRRLARSKSAAARVPARSASQTAIRQTNIATTFHCRSSGTQVVLRSNSAQRVNSRPSRSHASTCHEAAAPGSRCRVIKPNVADELIVATMASRAGVAPGGNGRGSGSSSQVPPLPAMNCGGLPGRKADCLEQMIVAGQSARRCRPETAAARCPPRAPIAAPHCPGRLPRAAVWYRLRSRGSDGDRGKNCVPLSDLAPSRAATAPSRLHTSDRRRRAARHPLSRSRIRSAAYRPTTARRKDRYSRRDDRWRHRCNRAR